VCLLVQPASRWSRLLLGREFQFSDTHVLRIWDCLFCACMVEGPAPEERISDPPSSDALCKSDLGDSNISDQSVIAGHQSSSSSRIAIDVSCSSDSSESTAYSPMLVALREFMLAMLIYVSTSNYNSVHSYPFDCSDMIIFMRPRYAKRS
jgi:hypothetical protein